MSVLVPRKTTEIKFNDSDFSLEESRYHYIHQENTYYTKGYDFFDHYHTNGLLLDLVHDYVIYMKKKIINMPFLGFVNTILGKQHNLYCFDGMGGHYPERENPHESYPAGSWVWIKFSDIGEDDLCVEIYDKSFSPFGEDFEGLNDFEREFSEDGFLSMLRELHTQNINKSDGYRESVYDFCILNGIPHNEPVLFRFEGPFWGTSGYEEPEPYIYGRADIKAIPMLNQDTNHGDFDIAVQLIRSGPMLKVNNWIKDTGPVVLWTGTYIETNEKERY